MYKDISSSLILHILLYVYTQVGVASSAVPTETVIIVFRVVNVCKSASALIT